MKHDRRKVDVGQHTELVGKKKMDYGVGIRRNGDPSVDSYENPTRGFESAGDERDGDPHYASYDDPPHKWVQKAVSKMEKKGTVGSLRAAHHVKEGQKIPVSTLKKDVSKGGKIAKKAQFALNVRK